MSKSLSIQFIFMSIISQNNKLLITILMAFEQKQ